MNDDPETILALSLLETVQQNLRALQKNHALTPDGRQRLQQIAGRIDLEMELIRTLNAGAHVAVLPTEELAPGPRWTLVIGMRREVGLNACTRIRNIRDVIEKRLGATVLHVIPGDVVSKSAALEVRP
jgi:hypothetical protein